MLYFTEEEAAKNSVAAMEETGIAAKYVHLSELKEDEIPEWTDKTQPGWILFIDRSKFNESMDVLMGYTPD